MLADKDTDHDTVNLLDCQLTVPQETVPYYMAVHVSSDLSSVQ